ncbi:MAG: hypothetical protein P8P30_04460 [Rickettsiales bacterium]|nr:hypothetical protein [Rickettsiales bacterium]
MGFLSSKNINLLNIHSSMMRLIDIVAWTFGPIFMYQLGLSVGWILIITAGINFCRIPFRFLMIPAIKKLGLKNTAILSSLVKCTAPMLLIGAGNGVEWIAAYVVFAGFSGSMYWTSFHCFYTLSGDKENRGRQFAVGEAVKLMLVALAPYMSGLFIEVQGFEAYFYLVIPVMIFAVMPLLLCQPIKMHHEPRAWREEFLTFGGKSHFWYAFVVDGKNIIWPLMLIVALGDISNFGAVFTVGMIAQAFIQLFLGSLIDKGHVWRVFVLGNGMMFLVLIAMGFTPLSLTIAAVLETLFAFALINQVSGFITSLYNDAHETKHTLWYWIFSEAWVDVGAVLVKILAAGLFFLEVPTPLLLLVCTPGLLGLHLVMNKHIKQQNAENIT